MKLSKNPNIKARNPTILLLALTLLLSCHNIPLVQARSVQYQVASASLPRYFGRRNHLLNTGNPQQSSALLLASSSRRRGSTDNYYESDSLNNDNDLLQRTRPVVARSTKKESNKSKDKKTKSKKNSDEAMDGDPFAEPMSSVEIYSQLNPVGKVVAGTVEIAVSTCMEYITGFMGGYVLGSVTDLPRFAFKQVDPNHNQAFFKELGQRYVRMHGKSFKWAKQWGGISAAFGGFKVATRVIRGGKEDEWNTVFSSMAAGAFFARNEGPQGMLRGAITYGGMMYLLSGGMNKKKEPFEYQEQPLEF